MMEIVEKLTSRLRPWDQSAAKWLPWLLILCAFVYYGLYFRHGLALTGEGGTNAVLAQRLMEGQRPIVDTFLGYNVGWFYPLVALFEFTGPHYLAMRAFFFCLATVSAILGAMVVLRMSGSGLLAFATGLVLVLIPGMMFRNYMGFLGVFNQLVLLWAFVWAAKSSPWASVWKMGLAGAALGITFLIRIEVGLLLLPVYAGVWVLCMLRPGIHRLRLFVAICGLLAAVLAWGAVHVPVGIDAHRRGYAGEFWGQYGGFKRYLQFLLREKIDHLRTTPTSETGWLNLEANDSSPLLRVSAGDAAGSTVALWRPRPPILEMFTGIGQRERYFAAAVYVPVLISVVWLAGGLAGLLVGFWKRDEEIWSDALATLVLLAGALALFPQYFFFRPDTPHITEFMIPFVVAVAGVFGMLARRFVLHPSRLLGTLTVLGAVAFVATVWLHFGHAWPKESAGTLAARQANTVGFRGLQGVHVLVPPDREEALRGLFEAIVDHSQPDDFIAVFPYSPTVHLMTARRSYLWNLYMDDTNRGDWFEQDQIRQLIEHRPPVVVIDDRDINRTESSRFRNWAPVLSRFIEEHYRPVGEFLGHEVFILEGAHKPLPSSPSASTLPAMNHQSS